MPPIKEPEADVEPEVSPEQRRLDALKRERSDREVEFARADREMAEVMEYQLIGLYTGTLSRVCAEISDNDTRFSGAESIAAWGHQVAMAACKIAAHEGVQFMTELKRKVIEDQMPALALEIARAEIALKRKQEEDIATPPETPAEEGKQE